VPPNSDDSCGCTDSVSLKPDMVIAVTVCTLVPAIWQTHLYFVNLELRWLIHCSVPLQIGRPRVGSEQAQALVSFIFTTVSRWCLGPILFFLPRVRKRFSREWSDEQFWPLISISSGHTAGHCVALTYRSNARSLPACSVRRHRNKCPYLLTSMSNFPYWKFKAKYRSLPLSGMRHHVVW